MTLSLKDKRTKIIARLYGIKASMPPTFADTARKQIRELIAELENKPIKEISK